MDAFLLRSDFGRYTNLSAMGLKSRQCTGRRGGCLSIKRDSFRFREAHVPASLFPRTPGWENRQNRPVDVEKACRGSPGCNKITFNVYFVDVVLIDVVILGT